MAWGETMKIYWMTDLHIKDSVSGCPKAENGTHRDRHYYAAKDKLQHALNIINKEKADFVVCTGDITDGIQPLTTFKEVWDKIDAPKELTIGNHDLSNGYISLVKQLGYEDRLTVARSKFNCSIPLQKGSIKARLIFLDTNIGEDGQHRTNSVEGAIQEDAFQWLENELCSCQEKTILVFSHNGLGGPVKFFDQQHVQRFKDIVDKAAIVKGEIKIINLAGHHHVHPVAVVKEMSPNLIFINGVAMIVGSSSCLNVVSLKGDGRFELEYREVKYPYI